MKKQWIKPALFALLFCLVTVHARQPMSPLSALHFSIFSQYSHTDLKTLKKEQAQEKLIAIFSDQLEFVTNHDIRKFAVKILNPKLYPFFDPANFSLDSADNVYFFLEKMSHLSQIEVIFDENPFEWDVKKSNTAFTKALCTSSFKMDEKTKALYKAMNAPELKSFSNPFEKLAYFDTLIAFNDLDQSSKAFGITDAIIDCRTRLDPEALQSVINLVDRYRFSGLNCTEPRQIGLAVVLPITAKAFCFANLAPFPLHNGLRVSQHSKDIGIKLPPQFPSSSPHFPSPVWRSGASMADRAMPLLSAVYLDMGDARLKDHLYHDKQILPLPSQYTPSALSSIAKRLESIFTSTPYMQGPGYVSLSANSVDVTGKYTLFKEGSKKDEGRFVNGQKIGFYLENSEQMQVRALIEDPKSNTQIKINSPLSFDQSIEHHPYYYSPFAVNWATPLVSRSITSKIFYVFDVNYTPGKAMAQGDWHLINFLHFLVNAKSKTGFLYTRLFKGFDNQWIKPNNNLVISDYSAIPNGSIYEEIDWNMGNSSF